MNDRTKSMETTIMETQTVSIEDEHEIEDELDLEEKFFEEMFPHIGFTISIKPSDVTQVLTPKRTIRVDLDGVTVTVKAKKDLTLNLSGLKTTLKAEDGVTIYHILLKMYKMEFTKDGDHTYFEGVYVTRRPQDGEDHLCVSWGS